MIATNAGLGYMLFVARDFYRTEVIVLGMIIIGVLWLLLFSQPRRKWAMTYQWVAARFPTADAGSSRHFRLPCGSYD